MIRSVILILAALCVVPPTYAGLLELQPQGAVNDFAGVLSAETKTGLESLAKALNEKTGPALVLVTVKDLEGETIDEGANKLFRKWGIGSKEKNDGVLVLLSVNDRAIRIEAGYGVEGYLTDYQSSRMVRTATPDLKVGNYDQGLTTIMVLIGSLVAQQAGTTLDAVVGSHIDVPVMRGPPRTKKGGSFLFFIIVAAIVLFSARRGSMLPLILLSMLGSGSYRGGGGFGGGGGGFGGFGGGMSGGGGASGRF